MSAQPATPWRNRIVGHEDVAPDQLLANPKNYRRHPAAQQKAMGGVLIRSLQRDVWPLAKFVAVCVGKKDCDIGNARRIVYPAPFTTHARKLPPYPSAPAYDAKAWEYFIDESAPGSLLWNVGS